MMCLQIYDVQNKLFDVQQFNALLYLEIYNHVFLGLKYVDGMSKHSFIFVNLFWEKVW